MNNFLSKIKYKKFLFLCLLALPLIILLSLLLFNNNYTKSDNRVTDGYHEVHDVKYEKIIDETAPQGVVKRYTMTIDDFHTNANCFAFYVVHHYAKVYIENELVYDFCPSKTTNVGRTLGCDWVIVPIIHDDENKIITVELTPVYFDVVEDEIEFLHGSQYDIFIDILVGDLTWLIIALACLSIGIVLIVGHLRSKYHHRAHDKSFVYLGLIAILISFWKLFDLDLAPLFIKGNPRLLFYISYISLMLAPLPLIKYVQCLFKQKNSFPLKLVFVVYFTTIVVGLCLHLFNVFDIRVNISLLLAIMIVTIISIIIIVMINGEFFSKKQESIKQLLPLFLGVLSIGGILDIIIYFVKGNTDNLAFTFISFFAYSLIIVINSLSENDKKYYRDFQTGLYNSNSCIEHLKEYANLKNCAIMMFDLNGLKYTNDNYGHAAGDRLIIDLTEILKKSIPMNDFIGRYGGDEFIAVIRDCNREKMKRIADNLERYTKDFNQDRMPKLSFAYGWALSNEHEGDLSELLKIADKNMYELKNKQKESIEE